LRRSQDNRGDDAIMPLFCPTRQSPSVVNGLRKFARGNKGILLCMGLFSHFLVQQPPRGIDQNAVLAPQCLENGEMVGAFDRNELAVRPFGRALLMEMD
jgi:hypothetical protein